MEWKERLNKWLNIVMVMVVIVFIGISSLKYIIFKVKPEIFGVQSAPWYLSILLYAIYAIIALLICLLIKWILKKRKK